MNKQAEFIQAKTDFAELVTVTEFSLSQVDYSNAGGKVNQFIVNQTNPLFVKQLVKYIETNSEVIIKAVQEMAKIELEALQLEANQEAIDFVNSNK